MCNVDKQHFGALLNSKIGVDVIWQVLLCQFHAILAIQKRLTDKQYSLRVHQREDIEDAWCGAIYAQGKEDFKMAWENLIALCIKIAPALCFYFEDNWFGCRHMWASHSRSQFFSVGNTTSNRLESSWKQMKSMVNFRPTFDNCLRGLFKYQLIRLHELRKTIIRYSTSTQVVQRPELLLLAKQTSTWTQKAVAQQFAQFRKASKAQDYVVSDESDMCVTLVTSGGVNTRKIDCRKWTCDCNFYMSTRLPCSHVMFVSLSWLKKDKVPIQALPQRWNMFHLSHELEICIAQTIECFAGVVHESDVMTMPEAACGTRISPVGKKSRVVYHKLKRNERCTTKVRSDVEKYNIAMAIFQPVLDNLVQSDSLQFYKKVAQLKDALSQIHAKDDVSFDPEVKDDEVKDDEVKDDAPNNFSSRVPLSDLLLEDESPSQVSLGVLSLSQATFEAEAVETPVCPDSPVVMEIMMPETSETLESSTTLESRATLESPATLKSPATLELQHPRTSAPPVQPSHQQLEQHVSIPPVVATTFTYVLTNVYRVPANSSVGEERVCCKCESSCTEACVNKAMLVECSESNCRVGETCGNRRLQRAEVPLVQAVRVRDKRWGLKVRQPVQSGCLISEHVGEVIGKTVNDSWRRSARIGCVTS